ncbi:SpoIIE family protein phosphatase [bacterium]|nr:SpoIIE family protein phosphatase [bacterium]
MKRSSAPENQAQTLEHENKLLRNAVEELSVLNEMATAIGSALSLDRIVNLMVGKCVKHFHCEQAAVMLLEPGQSANPLRTMVRKAETRSDTGPYRLDSQLTGWMLNNQKPLLINDLKNDERFCTDRDAACPYCSLLSVPLLSKGRMIGLLTVFNKKDPEGFDEHDQRLLSIIAGQSTQVIENARLLEKEKELTRMEEELRLAREIQMGLLPKASPQIKGYDIFGISIPAKIVGGDYFDFIQVSETQLAFCLGDVSGKGMPAALLMSNLQAAVRSQSLLETACCECMVRANTLLCRNTTPEKFATLFYGILDFASHAVRCCNAGHNYPFLFSGGRDPHLLVTGGPVLGFMEGIPFEQASYPLSPGDLLLAYSDGITEALNPSEDQYGEEKLAEIIRRNKNLSARELIQKILDDVGHFSANAQQEDDMTLLAIKRDH